MFKMFKKSFWIPYEEGNIYPSVIKAHQVISEYCNENKYLYSFNNDNEVIINGKNYEIYRGYESGSRGNYGIKLTEK